MAMVMLSEAKHLGPGKAEIRRLRLRSDTPTMSSHLGLLQSGEKGVGDAVPGVALVHQTTASLNTSANSLTIGQVAADGGHKLVGVINNGHTRPSNLLDPHSRGVVMTG